MKLTITKFVHSCLLVETDDRVALFDPGMMSQQALDIDAIQRLDDIFITHAHPDHFSIELIGKLTEKFPDVQITSTPEVVIQLQAKDFRASDMPPHDVSFFDSPHESVAPLYPQPQEIGINYLNVFSDPGDSQSFKQTKAILALPITGPWGGAIRSLNVALELKPRFVLPIHDWHWNEDARQQTYDNFERVLGEHGIKFFKLATGVPVVIEV